MLIIDEDKPGQIGFPDSVIDISRLESKYVIYLQRTGGSDGEISCTLRTISSVDMVPGNAAAVEGKDFVPIKDYLVKFKQGEISHKLTLDLPDCELDM